MHVNGNSIKMKRVKPQDKNKEVPPVTEGIVTFEQSDCIWTGNDDLGEITVQLCENCKHLKKGETGVGKLFIKPCPNDDED